MTYFLLFFPLEPCLPSFSRKSERRSTRVFIRDHGWTVSNVFIGTAAYAAGRRVRMRRRQNRARRDGETRSGTRLVVRRGSCAAPFGLLPRPTKTHHAVPSLLALRRHEPGQCAASRAPRDSARLGGLRTQARRRMAGVCSRVRMFVDDGVRESTVQSRGDEGAVRDVVQVRQYVHATAPLAQRVSERVESHTAPLSFMQGASFAATRDFDECCRLGWDEDGCPDART